MPIYETFSKRKRKLEQVGQADVYQYDSLPTAFRNQVVHIWKDTIGRWKSGYMEANSAWSAIHDIMARESGLPHLSSDVTYDLRHRASIFC